MSDEYTYLFIPQGVMRPWPAVNSEIPRLPGLKIESASLAPVFAPAVGYVPVYDSLDALIAEHGDVPYSVARQRKEGSTP